MGRKALDKEKYTATMSRDALAAFDKAVNAIGRTRSDVLEELARKFVKVSERYSIQSKRDTSK